MLKYKILEHTADLKVKVFGSDLEQLFANAGLAMMEFMYGKDIRYPLPPRLRRAGKISDIREKISIQSKDVESLLVDWLSELLYLTDTNNLAYTKFDFKKLTETELKAEVFGQQAQAKEDIKAVTYHQLEVRKTKEGWEAIIVFDI